LWDQAIDRKTKQKILQILSRAAAKASPKTTSGEVGDE
jgi:hypothetical protein